MNFKKLIIQGKDIWNNWMLEHSMTEVDLNGLNLSNLDLSDYNLCGVSAYYTNFSNCNLKNVDFSHARLENTNFTNANLSHANFDNAILNEANLNGVIAYKADFYQAILENADLSHGDFRKATFAMSRLINATLNGANLTDSILWETQRVLWSIKDIICEKCYWGENKTDPPSNYSKGEFEKLHKYNPVIKVHFSQGISPIEFYSLSHFVHGIQNVFDGSIMRISTITEAGKGARVDITLEKHNIGEYKQIENALNYLPQFMRDHNNKDLWFLEGVNKALQNTNNKLISELMKKNITKIGKIEAHNSIISTGEKSKNTLKLNFDKQELINLLNAFIEENNDNVSEKIANELKNELNKTNDKCNHSIIKSLSEQLNTIILGAAGSGTCEILSKSLQNLIN